jgi:hypothetical protein
LAATAVRATAGLQSPVRSPLPHSPDPCGGSSLPQALDYAGASYLPLHPLYEQGYTSIGCAPCTRAPRPGEGQRARRWWWEAGEDRECGLHQLSPSERLETALAEVRAEAALRRRPAAE